MPDQKNAASRPAFGFSDIYARDVFLRDNVRVAADDEWFKNHKVRDWYVREAMECEFDPLHRAFEWLKANVVGAADPNNTARICVLQLRPGYLYRVPVISRTKRNDEEVTIILQKDQKAIGPVEMRSQLLTEARTRGPSHRPEGEYSRAIRMANATRFGSSSCFVQTR